MVYPKSRLQFAPHVRTGYRDEALDPYASNATLTGGKSRQKEVHE